MTILWIFPGGPICWYLQDSIAWVVAMSWWALVGTHWSAWQSGIVEKKQEQSESSPTPE